VHYYAFQNAMRAVCAIADAGLHDVPVHGNTDIGILRAVFRREGFTDTEFQQKLPLILERMCAEVREKAAGITPVLCPSVRELLQVLKSAGKIMGVVSGNLETIGWLKIEAAGLREFFSFGCFSDRMEFRTDIFRNGVAEAERVLGRCGRICVIGDTPSDIAAAHELELPVVAVATGIYTWEVLAADKPDACFVSCAEMLHELNQS
jgi:phosphoglycolate phosphatase-like HAD superfamily hydrolase